MQRPRCEKGRPLQKWLRVLQGYELDKGFDVFSDRIQILETIFLATTKPIAATAQIVMIQAYCEPGTTPLEKKFTQ